MTPQFAVVCRKLMNHATQFEQVTSRIEPELRERLQVRREESGRSEGKEIRQAIRAWVADTDRDRIPAGTGAAV
jgi:hypothetical protein